MSEISSSPNDYKATPLQIGSTVWRKVLLAIADYESRWRRVPTTDPIAFAASYPEVPQAILVNELQRLREELSLHAEDQARGLAPTTRFLTLERIGTGGMGVIYRGFDRDCNRTVAIKKIRPEYRYNADAQRRFHSEAELTAELEHPGIIPIYAKGVDAEGQDFYAMRLISEDGAATLSNAIHTFHQQLRQSPWSTTTSTHTTASRRRELSSQLRDLIRHLSDVAETIAYAHSRGIVHRDLKPSNILLGPYGESLIADWGLARKIHGEVDTSFQQPDEFSTYQLSQPFDPLDSVTTGVGTQGYAPPESIQRLVGPALCFMDIYSLGATLYCILYGSPPSTKNNPRTSSNPLASFEPTVKYLEAIANKAMQTEVSKRYFNADGFRQDLLNWIAGVPVTACPEGWWEQAIRWPMRHRVAATALATSIAILLMGASLFLWIQSQQKSALDKQAVQLQDSLSRSSRLLIDTQKAETLAQQAQKDAELGREQANQNLELAEKRESLAFEGLLRLQDILLANQAIFQSQPLAAVHEQLLTQSKESFRGILQNLSSNSSPLPETPRYLSILTHRLAAMERSVGRNAESLAIIDEACGWMERNLNSPQLSAITARNLQQRLGELRSLQGNIALLMGNPVAAEPFVADSIERLESLVHDESMDPQEIPVIHANLAQSYSARASIELNKGDIASAKSIQQKAIDHLASVPASSHFNIMAHAQSHYGMAILYDRSGDSTQALEELRQASEVMQLVTDIGPDVLPQEFLSYRSELTQYRMQLLLAKNDVTSAINVLQEQLEHDTAHLARTPENPILLGSYKQFVLNLQSLMIRSGDHRTVTEISTKWTALADSLLLMHPFSFEILDFAITAHHTDGHLDEQFNRRELSIAEYLTALELCDRAEKINAQAVNILSQRVELEVHVFLLLYSTFQRPEHEAVFERAVNAAEKLRNVSSAKETDLQIVVDQLHRGIVAMQSAQDEQMAEKWEAILRAKGLDIRGR